MSQARRRIAILLALSLFIGLFAQTGKMTASSKLTVKLIITNKFVTGKTYSLKKGKHRQLSVRLDNSFGKASVSFKSSNKKVATISKKGYIVAKKKGTAKMTVKVTCKSGKKKKTKSVWVKIKVTTTSSSTPTPNATATPSGSSSSGDLQALLLVNGATDGQFPLSILDNESGRMLYNSLPKVLYLTDQNKESKIGTETELEYKMDEYKPGTINTGDLMLFGVDKYELSYKDHQSGYAYTRLGRVTANASGLADKLGSGPVSITIIKSTLPTVPPTATIAPTNTPTPTPSGSPTGSPGGSESSVPTGSITPVPTGPTPSGSTAVPSTATIAPTNTPTPTPSGSSTATPTPSSSPSYGGPRIRISTNGWVYYVQVEQSCKLAMDFYNSLPSDETKPEELFMTPYSSYRYFITLPREYSTDESKAEGRWPAGSLVMMGKSNLCVFLKTETNNDYGTIIGKIDTTSLPTEDGSTTFLRTMFAETPYQTVGFSKV